MQFFLHIRGADDEEVTFDDLRRGTDESKAGYQKIAFPSFSSCSSRVGIIK
jgi:hypothetical protein